MISRYEYSFACYFVPECYDNLPSVLLEKLQSHYSILFRTQRKEYFYDLSEKNRKICNINATAKIRDRSRKCVFLETMFSKLTVNLYAYTYVYVCMYVCAFIVRTKVTFVSIAKLNMLRIVLCIFAPYRTNVSTLSYKIS